MIFTEKDPSSIIKKINSVHAYSEVFEDIFNWKNEYKNIIKLIHPDICKLNGAEEAILKLNLYREELLKGKTHRDDAGDINYNLNICTIIGDKNLLAKSNKSLTELLSLKDKVDISFQRYIPRESSLKDSKLELNFGKKCIPLSSIGTLPLQHVLWILSRMLEFIGYLHMKGYVHAGINPDSVYIEPLNHGINVISFYHMTQIGEKLKTASGTWINFYPEHIRTKKIATPDIDIELCKRTAIYMLGDKSGIGTVLRKTNSAPLNAFLDFISKKHNDAFEAYKEYRDMINKNFERKFIPLVI